VVKSDVIYELLEGIKYKDPYYFTYNIINV